MASTPTTQAARIAEHVSLEIQEDTTKISKEQIDQQQTQHQTDHKEAEKENTKALSCGSRLSICIASCSPFQVIRHALINSHLAPPEEIFDDENTPKSMRKAAISHLPTYRMNVRPIIEEEEEEKDQKNVRVVLGRRASKRDLTPQREELIVSHLSIPIQVAFRQKILRLLTYHVAFVTCAISMVVFVLLHGFGDDLEATSADNFLFEILLGSGFMMTTIALCFLYVIRFEHPSNMLVLAFFTFFEMFFFVVLSMSVRFQSVLLACALTASSVVLNLGVATYQRCNDATKEYSLFSAFTCSCLSMTTVTIVAVSAFLMLGEEHAGLTTSNLMGCLGFVSLFNGWMGLSTHFMYESMTPDEYVNALVFFYTDLIAILIIPLDKLWKCVSNKAKSLRGSSMTSSSSSEDKISETTMTSTKTRERIGSSALSPTSAAARRRSLAMEEEFNAAIDV